MKRKYVYSETGANLSIIRIYATHCFCCGIQMQKLKKYPARERTEHHAIPEELRPYRNIILPLCKGCHKKIHQDSQAMNPKKLKVLRKVKAMKRHYSTIDDGFDKILKDLEGENDES